MVSYQGKIVYKTKIKKFPFDFKVINIGSTIIYSIVGAFDRIHVDWNRID